jgi:hypothetical protein
MSVGIIVKNYEHMNRSFPNWDTPRGKYISSRAHYEREMAKNGMIPFEQAEQIKNTNTHKPYDGISAKAMEVCYAAKQMADKKGKLRIGSRLQKGMESVGVSFDMSKLPKNNDMDMLPSHYQRDIKQGGFDGT